MPRSWSCIRSARSAIRLGTSVAIANRARQELAAFAEQAARSAGLAQEPWRRAVLEVPRAVVNAGESFTIMWAAPDCQLPVFLRVGANAAWEQVPLNGRREVQVELADVSVALRVGPHIARELTVRCAVPAPRLELYPAENRTVPFGQSARVEWYAGYAQAARIRHNGGPWREAPTMGAIELPPVVGSVRVDVQVTGWDASNLVSSVTLVPEWGNERSALAEFEAAAARAGTDH